jgi:hypothetical protein
MMRALKSVLALVAAAVIVGQLVTGQRAVIEPRDGRLPLLSNSEATRVLVCGLVGTATRITLTGFGTAMLHPSLGGSRNTCARAEKS